MSDPSVTEKQPAHQPASQPVGDEQAQEQAREQILSLPNPLVLFSAWLAEA